MWLMKGELGEGRTKVRMGARKTNWKSNRDIVCRGPQRWLFKGLQVRDFHCDFLHRQR